MGGAERGYVIGNRSSTTEIRAASPEKIAFACAMARRWFTSWKFIYKLLGPSRSRDYLLSKMAFTYT